MIENLLGGGGKGGTVDSVQAGTGISVDSTDPANPIVSSTVVDTNDAVKISSNDTTAGFLNGKLVAGTSITLTENNNGGNETLGIAVGNIDAGLITSGTIATARLGTGTANSSTYLAGDQTYKAAVTSVNGATGAVVIGAGDTTYTVTTADAENSTTAINVLSFTVPANTWADGEIIYLQYTMQTFNNSGVSRQLTHLQSLNGSTIGLSYNSTVNTNSTIFYLQNILIYQRLGSTLSFIPQSADGNYLLRQQSGLWNGTGATPSTVAATFSSNITIALNLKWDFASPVIYSRIFNARAFKPSGQSS